MSGPGPAPTAGPVDATPDRWHRPRMILAGIYLLALVVVVAAWGFPASRDRLLPWVFGALLIAVVGRPHALARLAVDFLPVFVFLFAYDLFRGTADGLVGHIFTLPQLRVDEWLFGGNAPTVTLQRAMWTPGDPQPWDYLAFVVYLTYFVLPISVAAALWRYSRSAFRRFVGLWLGLSFAALATYSLYPATPPWLASREGFLPHVARLTPIMSRTMGVELTRVMESQRFVNKVAAVPSLHAGTALLITLFFWSWTRRWRWALALYPLAMGFALVYLGEHYVSDVLLGWCYAIVVFVVGNRLYDGWVARSAAKRGQGSLDTPAPRPSDT